MAFALDIGDALRAISIEALRARWTFRRRPASRTRPVDAKSAHTLQIRRALRTVSVQTLRVLRAITIIRASRAFPIDALPTTALAVPFALSAGAQDACLARRAVFPVSAGVFDGAESAAAVMIQTVPVVAFLSCLKAFVSASDAETLRIAGAGVRSGSGSLGAPLILTGQVRTAAAAPYCVAAVGSGSRHGDACISAAFEVRVPARERGSPRGLR